MPNLKEIIKERETKKFVKKSYRPWDLTGDGQSPLDENNPTAQENYPQEDATQAFHKTIEDSIQPKEVLVKISKEIDSTIGNIKVSDREQRDIKQISIRNHIDNTRNTNQESFGNPLDINLDPTTVYNQLLKLSGIQKNILDFIIDICTTRNGLDTGPIETTTIALCVQTTIGTTKISLKRLIDKGFIIRNKGKQAKGGYVNLGVSEAIYTTVMQQREKYNRVTNPAEFIQSIRYQIENNERYSSNNNIKNITTTKKQVNLPEEWQRIDCEALAPIGFTTTQLKQLVEKNEPSLVQESINHFAFGLEHNQKLQKYDDPLNVLMGVLRKGQSWLEKDYRSPKELAQRQLYEMKKAEIERKRELEDEAYKLAFIEWQQHLSTEEIEQIAPSKRRSGDITPQPAKLSLYFKENIWPEIRVEYLV